MSPRNHLIISFVAGLFFSLLIYGQFSLQLISVAVVAGTLIDADHFLVGRLYHDDWRFLNATFSDVLGSINNVQEVVEEEADMPGEYRLFSHMVILVLLLTATFITDLLLLEAAVFSISLHIASDLFADCFLW